MLHRDGTLTDVLYNASVYRDINGTVLGVLAVARDASMLRHQQLSVQRRGRRWSAADDVSSLERQQPDAEEHQPEARHHDPRRGGPRRCRYPGEVSER